MARTARVPGQPYSTTVGVKLNAPGVKVLDELRGRKSRSEFFRDLLREERKRRKG